MFFNVKVEQQEISVKKGICRIIMEKKG